MARAWNGLSDMALSHLVNLMNGLKRVISAPRVTSARLDICIPARPTDQGVAEVNLLLIRSLTGEREVRANATNIHCTLI